MNVQALSFSRRKLPSFTTNTSVSYLYISLRFAFIQRSEDVKPTGANAPTSDKCSDAGMSYTFRVMLSLEARVSGSSG